MTATKGLSLLTLLVTMALAMGADTCETPNDWPITNEEPTGTNIIAYGDSLTGGGRAEEGEDYPAILSTLIGKPIMNRGTGGTTTESGLRRLDSAVLRHDPRIVLLCIGGNDMLNNYDVDRQFANLRTIVERIQKEGALVILIGIEGSPALGHPLQTPRYEKLAREKGCVFIPDILRDIAGNPTLMADSHHPNGIGNRMIAQRILEEAGEYLLK